MSATLLDHLRQTYDFNDWPALDTAEPKVFFWRLSLSELFGAKPRRLQQRELGEDCRLTTSLWSLDTKKGDSLLRLDIYECRSRAAARDRLLDLLGNFQSPLVARREAPEIGEVVFGPPSFGSLVYVRGNLAVFLANAGGITQPMDGFAKKLIQQLMAEPVEVSGCLLPTIRLDLKVQKKHPKNTPLVLDIEAEDPLGKGCWCRIESQLGEVSLQDGTLKYRSTQAGKETLRVYAVAPDGRSVQIERKFTVG